MKSAKKIFIWIDFISLIIIFSILFVILIFIKENIKNQYAKNQISELKKIDMIIYNMLNDKKEEFQLFLNNKNNPDIGNFITNFSDIYSVDQSYTINKIYKKDKHSHIFTGYNLSNSKLYKFLLQVDSDHPQFSPLIPSPEKEELSIYLSTRMNGELFIGRIGIDKINAILKPIAIYNNNIILIMTKDGYIISTTNNKIPFEILPELSLSILKLDKKYLYTRQRSEFLSDDFALLKPISDVYLIFDTLLRFYPLFILIILIIYFTKIILQFYLIFEPLEILLSYIKNFKNNPLNKDTEFGSLKIIEISELYKTFHDKMDQIELNLKTINQTNYEIEKIKLYLKNIIDSMPSMLISIDNHGIIQEWNQAAVTYFGLSSVDTMGKVLWEVLPHFSRYQQVFQQVIETKTIQELKRELLTNGEDKYMNISFFPLEENGIKGMAIRLDDITQLEKTEQILRQSQKMETIGTLAGGIAHDFNNILGGIVGTLSMMKLRTNNTIDLNTLRSHYNSYMNLMDDASQRAVNLVSHLLTLSRRQEPNFSLIDLNFVFQQIETICKNTFEKSIEIIVKPYFEPAVINADINQIEQVLLNICINSAHAMTLMKAENDVHGGLLSLHIQKIKSDKHFIKNHPEAKENLNYFILSVSDTGIGMEPNTLSKIFDPFFTTKDKGKGTGLGLSMVYNIVQLHKGFIDVYSELNHGTTFNIYLPILKSETPIQNNITENILTHGTGKILIIDDELIIRNMYHDMLSECGYEVYLAIDGLNGIEFYKNHFQEIELIVLDMAMPKLSGTETYIKLKEINPHLKVLMASGFRQDERVVKAINLGVNGFLQKPFTVETLSRAIKNILIVD